MATLCFGVLKLFTIKYICIECTFVTNISKFEGTLDYVFRDHDKLRWVQMSGNM